MSSVKKTPSCSDCKLRLNPYKDIETDDSNKLTIDLHLIKVKAINPYKKPRCVHELKI